MGNYDIATKVTRLNIGCGRHPLHFWTNLDADPTMPADLHCSVPPLPFESESLSEIFAGHFLEHLSSHDADLFLQECARVLVPGGELGIVVPDTRAIMQKWLDGENAHVEFPIGVWRNVGNLDTICELFLYSTVQESGHKWSYDLLTLREKLTSNGFQVTGEINRWMDKRITVGAWYQCGLDAVKA